jgi:phytoene dehydrogenase-like protein
MAALEKRDYDAVVVGSGPNGLAAALTLQQAGLSVLIVEGKDSIGGGLRSGELTLPGFTHDICSAIHPLAVSSPFFAKLKLQQHGLEFIEPTFCAAHPFDNGRAAVLDHSIDNTAALLGPDKKNYLKLISPIVRDWSSIQYNVLGPLGIPSHPMAFARFGMNAILPASIVAKRFHSAEGKALWAGMAGHSMLPLDCVATSAIGIVLLTSAHGKGWPIPKGGSQAIAQAMAACFVAGGGKIITNFYVKSLAELPSAHAVLFDVSPKQLLGIAGHRFSALYIRQLQKYRYGMGVFKIDWALDGPIPFTSPECGLAGTVHIGNTYDEIAWSEKQSWNGKHAEKPFVLLAQQSLFDRSRAPEDKHTAWAYCHVPNGSSTDMTAAIESQVERFAPGFKDRVLARHTMNTQAMEEYNPNYVGGDINGGAITIGQLFTRPALRLSPYRTSAKGLYICSASTPPGGGVHGMCGFHAAKTALKDIFNIRVKS